MAERLLSSNALADAPNDHGADHIPTGYDPTLYRIRHSAAHMLAQAVLERFPGTAIAIGPPIEDGFYYDFDLPRSPTEEDLQWLIERMRALSREDHPFHVREVTPREARAIFADQPYKLALIEGLLQGQVDENGNPMGDGAVPVITVYQQDHFVDLCRGPHVASTGEIDPAAIQLMNVAGAYWRGDEHNPMLTRIYGTAWRNKAELEQYLWRLEEAAKRDHRRLGKQLELFHFDPTAPGMPYWLPKGLKVLNELLAFWRQVHEEHDYQEIASPLFNERKLYEISGHWEHYRDGMFLIPIDEHTTYGLKPMNCPNAMVVFNLKVRSYRELPLRLSDCDMLHRKELSGTLQGLLRVQKFQQDDAHIFVAEDQIEEEYGRIFALADLFYHIFGLTYRLRLGTRPESYVGDLATWQKAEQALRNILDQHVGPGNYWVEEGDGAFYGPKVDIVMEDALGRSWQMGTIQLDFQLPRRFGCTYVDRDGSEKTPVVIHRVIYGSMERFIGILIEHTAGALPIWLAPVQARVIPITDHQVAYAAEVANQLRKAGLRVEVDDSAKRMNAKIRDAQVQKVPYMLVVGKREMAQAQVAVRLRSEEDLGAMSVAAFIALAQEAIAEKQ
ncbi:MAG: threonine--tRNA ligase [Caldilineaceae bacterium]|nr:threonine--tRNA ligase [Caldilineaceae bacterium]